MTFAALQVNLPDRRYGRIFASTPGDLGKEVVDRFLDVFTEEDDVQREAPIRDLFRKGVVLAWLHPGDDDGDIIHVYLQSVRGGLRFFACVIVSQERLEAMLHEAKYVLEGFTLQVVDVRHLTLDALRAAVGAWAERCLPGTVTPTFVMRPWSEEPVVAMSTGTVVPGVNARPQHSTATIEIPIANNVRFIPGPNRRLHQASDAIFRIEEKTK